MKLIDIWLLIAIAVPFVEVILNTIINYHKLKQNNKTFEMREKEDRRLRFISYYEWLARYGVPILYFLFAIGFGLYGLFLSFVKN